MLGNEGVHRNRKGMVSILQRGFREGCFGQRIEWREY